MRRDGLSLRSVQASQANTKAAVNLLTMSRILNGSSVHSSTPTITSDALMTAKTVFPFFSFNDALCVITEVINVPPAPQ